MRAQLLGDAGVDGRKRFTQCPIARGGVHRRSVDDVLDQDREAHRGAEVLVLGPFFVHQLGFRHRVGVDLRDGVEPRAGLVESLDAVLVGLDQVDRCHLAFLQHFLGLAAREVFDIERGGESRGAAAERRRECQEGHEKTADPKPEAERCNHLESFLGEQGGTTRRRTKSPSGTR